MTPKSVDAKCDRLSGQKKSLEAISRTREFVGHTGEH